MPRPGELPLRALVAEATGLAGGRDLFSAGLDDPATRDLPITGVVVDSRRVERGSLFVCIPGAVHDGHDFAPDAVARGAAAVVCERRLDLEVPLLETASSRSAVGPLAAVMAGEPSRNLAVVGVTGTNGKTTSVHLLHSVLEHAGVRAGVIGTLTGERTTPEAPDLQAALADHVDAGHRAVAMEVSSHALDQHRVDGTWFEVAVFTNLSPDHLDYHGDLESYFRAKASLFRPERVGTAVVNIDSPEGAELADSAGMPVVEVSLADAEVSSMRADGSTFGWRGRRVDLPVAGRFNIANALGVAEAALLLGLDEDQVAAGLSAAADIPGRFEQVRAGQAFPVVVDYAHTPDGLEQVLTSARELVPGAVVCVFGCGGDRDRAKRPLMGRVAAALADAVIVTSDNPRSEDPDRIIAAILGGIDPDAGVMVEPDRRRAIARALEVAGPDDIVVIAGKGHETTQTVGREVVAFDDRTVARELLEAAA